MRGEDVWRYAPSMNDQAPDLLGAGQQLEALQRDLAESEARLAVALAERAAEAARRQRLAAIVEASRDAIWSWNADGIIDSWNAEAERLFQYSADEIVGKPLFVLVPPERMDRARDAVANLLEGGWYEQYETVRVRKDGAPVQVELTVSPIKDQDGKVTGIATICRDVTARLAQEAALRASEARFAQAFQLAPVAMTISTLDEGRYLDVNAAMLEATGYAREEVVGRTARELAVYPDADDFTRIRRELEKRESFRNMELRLRGKHGDVRTVLLSGGIIEWTGRRCLLTASIDITARKTFEADLARSEARYRAAVITGRIAAWETDMVTLTRHWTKEGMELFGIDLPDGRGKVRGPDDEFWRALHPDDKHMMAEFHRTADEQDSYPCEYRIVRPDGRVLWVSGRGRVVSRGPDGKAQRVANIVVDVTDRKKAEEHVQMLMREISHRSKNLLAVVQAIAGQTARRAETLGDFRERFGRRLRSLAASHDLLVTKNWQGAPLRELVREQLAAFAERGARLDLDGPDIVLSAAAAQTIGMALHELATNATKYGSWSVPGGRVAIEWQIERGDEPMLRLAWVESGGPPVRPPVRKGFGHVVFEQMVAQQLGGEVQADYARAGLCWKLTMPLASVAATSAEAGSAG